MIHKKPLLIYLLATFASLIPSQATQTHPLHKAVKDGDLEKCRQIIENTPSEEREALVNKKAGSETPLIIAAKKGFLEITKLLCHYGADPEKIALLFPPLHYAALNGHLNICKYFLEEQLVGWESYPSNHPITMLASIENLEICDLFLEYGYDINTVSSIVKWNALHFTGNSLEKCTWLIKNGININQKDLQGQTPLFLFAQQGNLDICELLIDNGADTSIRDDESNTFLTNAHESIRPRLQTLVREQRRNQNRKILFFTLKLIGIVLAITTLAIITTLIASKKMAKKKKTKPSAYHESDENITLYKSHRKEQKSTQTKKTSPEIAKVK